MKGDISVKLDMRKLNEAIKELGPETAKVFTDIVLHITGEAVRDAPIDTGDLRGSGFAEINGVTVAQGNSSGVSAQGVANPANKYSAVIGFTEPYALRQHEELEYNHPQGGKAKYLEDAVKRNMTKSIEHIKKGIKKAVE